MDEVTNIETQVLDHYGLVAAIEREMGLIKIIDKILSKRGQKHFLSHGQAIFSLILCGLGFEDRRLYSMRRFLHARPVELLFGKGILASMFTDDCLGRALDAINKYGPQNFFLDFSGHLLKIKKFHHYLVNMDTTSLSLHGKFPKEKNKAINMTYGHSKDHRPDLPQLILALALSGPASLPFWLNIHSGNENDKKILPNMVKNIEDFRTKVALDQDWIYAADSALYSRKFLLNGNSMKDFKWITRVPESIKSARTLLEKSKVDDSWETEGDYKFTSSQMEYAGVKQRWIIVFHRKSFGKEMGTLKKKIQKESKLIKNILKKRDNHLYQKRNEINKFILEFKKKHPNYDFFYDAYTKRAPSKKGKKKKLIGYKAFIGFRPNKGKYNRLKNKKGKFILTTNEMDEKKLSDSDVFNSYRKQAKVERGFRFIKDPSFRIGQVFLKKPERIQALIVVMVLTLLLHNYGQWWMREKIRGQNFKFKNQLGKPSSSPSAKWIFQSFQKIVLVKYSHGKKVKEFVSNVSQENFLLLKCLGREACSIYGFP